MANLDSLVNRRLNGYFIEALLGRGGMARVYRGVDVHLQRYVAVKVIDAEYRNDPSQASRFEREARVIAQLGQHPNIVRVYHYGEDQGHLFIAMEYIEGADLAMVLRSYQQQGERMPFEEVLNVAREISAALDYMHSHGVIHRDLKPSNIMLDRHGRAILTDFGIALFTPTGTLGEVFGSPHYISPEQAVSSAQARPQSDIYSLGVVLYEMFTGRLPFESDNPMNLAMMHMSQPPPSPRQFRPELSPAVEAVILKALAKQPEERYPTGAALYADLERAVRSTWRNAPPPTLAHLTISEQVRRKSQPLPPPSLPPETLASLDPQPTSNEPLVIPVGTWQKRPAAKRRWGCLAALALAAVLACAGGLLGWNALRSLTGGAALFPGRTPVAVEPAETATPAVTPSPALPPTAAPTPTTDAPQDEPTLAPQEAYELLIVKFSGDYIVISNNGEEVMPLPPLQLSQTRDGIAGVMWGVQDLEPGDCVVAMRRSKKLRLPPDPGCNVIGMLEGSAGANFWNRDFAILYNSDTVGECAKDEDTCLIQIPINR